MPAAIRVNLSTTHARITATGSAEIYSNCVRAENILRAVREEVIERARAIARENRHERFTVLDETRPLAGVETFDTLTETERFEVMRVRRTKQRGQWTTRARLSRRTTEIVGHECAFCYVPLTRLRDKRLFLCRDHQWPFDRSVERDLRYGKTKEEGDEAVEAHGEECQAAADRARTRAYRKAGRADELFELEA